MNKKQTAVEFLKQEYIKRGDCLPSGVFQDALEMERKQIIDSYNTGYLDCECNHINDADQHYHQLTERGEGLG